MEDSSDVNLANGTETESHHSQDELKTTLHGGFDQMREMNNMK